MKIILLIFFFFVTRFSAAQYNLVPNPSFEQYDTCPDFAGQIQHAIPWLSPLVGTTTDYFCSCDTSVQHIAGVPDNFAGFQYARTGNAYAALITASFPPNHAAWNYREYIQVELTDSLLAGVTYCLRFYASACDFCNYVSNNIGIYFSTSALVDTCPNCVSPIAATPQFENLLTNNLNDRIGWTEVSGTYTALGNEKFLILGNFHDTSSTIAFYTGWSPPGAFFNALYFIDDVLVTPCDSLSVVNNEQFRALFSIYPNPFDRILNLEASDQDIKAVKIFDVLGHLIYEHQNLKKGIFALNLQNLVDGIYFLNAVSDDLQFNIKLIKKQ